MTMLFCIAESEIKVIHTYIHTYNAKSGNGRKTIEWFDELDRTMGRRPASQSHLLLQSGTEMQLKAAFEDESDDKT